MEGIEFMKIVLDIPVNTQKMKIEFNFDDQQVAVSDMDSEDIGAARLHYLSLMEEKYDR